MPITAPNREALARRIEQLERTGGRRNATMTTVPLQCPAIDSVLPDGGLRTGAVHEVLGPVISDGHTGDKKVGQPQDQRGDGAVMGFACVVLARLMQAPGADAGPVVWCMNRRLRHRHGLLSGQVYAPGLHSFGIAMQRLLFVYGGNDEETLWATEEALRSAAVGVVVAELFDLHSLAARRLQLAAEASATTVLALRPGHAGAAGGFVETRWRAASLTDGSNATAAATAAAFGHWRIELLRARRRPAGGRWSVRWQDRQLEAVREVASDVSVDRNKPGDAVRFGRR